MRKKSRKCQKEEKHRGSATGLLKEKKCQMLLERKKTKIWASIPLKVLLINVDVRPKDFLATDF